MVVLGLGNPGAKYCHTRHNAGFDVVERTAAFFQVTLRKRCFRSYRHASTPYGRLVQPLTYMNRSGEIIRYFKDEPFIVVLDQMDLPVGALRVRQGGGSAGHRGLKSIIEYAGTSDFPRIYVGIGRPEEGRTVVEHVLERVDDPVYENTLALASEALVCCMKGEKIESVASRFNRKRPQ